MSNAHIPCILLIDDDIDLLQLMKSTLEKDGFVVEAMSQAPSREDLRRLRPDLIFLDVEIGAENGAALCHSIKHDHEQARPVVLISGHAGDTLRSEAACGLADGFLAKPFSMRELREKAAYFADAITA